jgi:hypothetical protein
MEYDGMIRGMVNQDEKYWWYLMMQSMSKSKKEEKTVMSKGIDTLEVNDYLCVVRDV